MEEEYNVNAFPIGLLMVRKVKAKTPKEAVEFVADHARLTLKVEGIEAETDFDGQYDGFNVWTDDDENGVWLGSNAEEPYLDPIWVVDRLKALFTALKDTQASCPRCGCLWWFGKPHAEKCEVNELMQLIGMGD